MYTAIVFGSLSHDILKMVSKKNEIPEKWKLHCHHCTINMGPHKNSSMSHVPIGTQIIMSATHIGGIYNHVAAVKVKGDFKSSNSNPHITLAVNEEGGAKPKESNNIINWKPLPKAICIVGILEEIE